MSLIVIRWLWKYFSMGLLKVWCYLSFGSSEAQLSDRFPVGVANCIICSSPNDQPWVGHLLNHSFRTNSVACLLSFTFIHTRYIIMLRCVFPFVYFKHIFKYQMRKALEMAKFNNMFSIAQHDFISPDVFLCKMAFAGGILTELLLRSFQVCLYFAWHFNENIICLYHLCHLSDDCMQLPCCRLSCVALFLVLFEDYSVMNLHFHSLEFSWCSREAYCWLTTTCHHYCRTLNILLRFPFVENVCVKF